MKRWQACVLASLESGPASRGGGGHGEEGRSSVPPGGQPLAAGCQRSWSKRKTPGCQSGLAAPEFMLQMQRRTE